MILVALLWYSRQHIRIRNRFLHDIDDDDDSKNSTIDVKNDN